MDYYMNKIGSHRQGAQDFPVSLLYMHVYAKTLGKVTDSPWVPQTVNQFFSYNFIQIKGNGTPRAKGFKFGRCEQIFRAEFPVLMDFNFFRQLSCGACSLAGVVETGRGIPSGRLPIIELDLF